MQLDLKQGTASTGSLVHLDFCYLCILKNILNNVLGQMEQYMLNLIPYFGIFFQKGKESQHFLFDPNELGFTATTSVQTKVTKRFASVHFHFQQTLTYLKSHMIIL